MAILEAVRDHNGLYGASTLQKMLLGEAYGKRDGNSTNSRPMPVTPSTSGPEGVLTRARLQEYIERLIAGGQLAIIEKFRPGMRGVSGSPAH